MGKFTGRIIRIFKRHYSSASGTYLGSIKVNMPLEKETVDLPNQNTFYVNIKGTDNHNRPAFIKYVIHDLSTVDLTYTYVPPSLRRKGIGKELTRLALNHLKHKGVNIKLSCYYLQKQYQRNFSSDPLLNGRVILS